MKRFVTFIGILTIIYDFVVVKFLDLLGLGFTDAYRQVISKDRDKKDRYSYVQYNRREPRDF